MNVVFYFILAVGGCLFKEMADCGFWF